MLLNIRQAASCSFLSPVILYMMKTDSIASGLYQHQRPVNKKSPNMSIPLLVAFLTYRSMYRVSLMFDMPGCRPCDSISSFVCSSGSMSGSVIAPPK